LFFIYRMVTRTERKRAEKKKYYATSDDVRKRNFDGVKKRRLDTKAKKIERAELVVNSVIEQVMANTISKSPKLAKDLVGISERCTSRQRMELIRKRTYVSQASKTDLIINKKYFCNKQKALINTGILVVQQKVIRSIIEKCKRNAGVNFVNEFEIEGYVRKLFSIRCYLADLLKRKNVLLIEECEALLKNIEGKENYSLFDIMWCRLSLSQEGRFFL